MVGKRWLHGLWSILQARDVRVPLVSCTGRSRVDLLVAISDTKGSRVKKKMRKSCFRTVSCEGPAQRSMLETGAGGTHEHGSLSPAGTSKAGLQ